MTEILQLTMERVQNNMDDILTNFKDGAKITVLVRTPGKPTADFCLTSDTLDEVVAMIERRKAEAPPPQTNVDVEGEIASVVQSVCDWDDRTSPDDYPDHLLITPEELAELLRNFAEALATTEGSEE